jgi:hypothetical protein
VKSGTRSRIKTLNASVTFIKGSPIKATGMSISDHHSQLLCHSNRLFNHQLFSLNFTLQSPCRTFRQRLQPSQLSLNLQHPDFRLRSLSLLCCRGRLHKTAVNVTGLRPFQRRKSQSSRSVLDWQSFHHHHQAPRSTTSQQLSQIDKEAEVLTELSFLIFTQLLDVWPFHRQQLIDNQGWTRYRLTQEEREQLKFLGLQNLFNTSWLKPGLHHRELGRWKKSYRRHN